MTVNDVAHMSAEDIFSFRQQYANRVRQLLQAGAESASSSLHRELLGLITVWVRSFWHTSAFREGLLMQLSEDEEKAAPAVSRMKVSYILLNFPSLAEARQPLCSMHAAYMAEPHDFYFDTAAMVS